jgi:hypothetical protein
MGLTMFLRVVRVLFGFILACLAAGLTIVLFVYTPAELASLSSDTAADRLSEIGLFALAAATHSAVFAAPFALIGAAIGEWRGIGSWTYYLLVGIAIAALGFAAQYSSEAAGEASIFNSYALAAFLVTGFAAGVVYWLFSGRYAAYSWTDEEPPLPDITRPPAHPASPSTGLSAASPRIVSRYS